MAHLTERQMTRSAFLKFAHKVTAGRNIAFYGSYQKAFAAVLRELYAAGYHRGGNAFQVIEPWYLRKQYKPLTGRWVTP